MTARANSSKHSSLIPIEKIERVIDFIRGEKVMLDRDLAKLLRKDSLVPEPSSWVFRAGPWVVLGATLTAATLVPLVGLRGQLGAGDLIAIAGLLALARFAQALAALDTGSAFGGMGASREMAVASLIEPALLAAIS